MDKVIQFLELFRSKKLYAWRHGDQLIVDSPSGDAFSFSVADGCIVKAPTKQDNAWEVRIFGKHPHDIRFERIDQAETFRRQCLSALSGNSTRRVGWSTWHLLVVLALGIVMGLSAGTSPEGADQARLSAYQEPPAATRPVPGASQQGNGLAAFGLSR